MIKILKKLFGTRSPKNKVVELMIENNIPLTVKGVPFDDVMKMYTYLKNLKINQSFPIEPRLAHTVRKIANQNYPEIKITIRDTGKFFRVYRLA